MLSETMMGFKNIKKTLKMLELETAVQEHAGNFVLTNHFLVQGSETTTVLMFL